MEKFIGWVAWEADRPPFDLGRRISDVFKGYSGPVFAYDVASDYTNEIGIVFVKENIPGKKAMAYFEKVTKDSLGEMDC